MIDARVFDHRAKACLRRVENSTAHALPELTRVLGGGEIEGPRFSSWVQP
jgi:hypothetical protein